MIDYQLRIGACLLVWSIAYSAYLEREQIKAWWGATIGVWFARRRMVSSFTGRRYSRIRVGSPDEHSRGLMTSRRDMTTGCGA